MNYVVTTLAPSCLLGSSFYLPATRTPTKPRMGSKFGQIGPWTGELAALERLEKSPLTFIGKNVLTTLVPSLLGESSSFLQLTIIPNLKILMRLNFRKIPSLTLELAAIEHLKKTMNNVDSFLIGSFFCHVTRTWSAVAQW